MSLGQRIGIVSLLSLLANLAAFGKNMAIAARFGVSGPSNSASRTKTQRPFW